ncbi:DNA polymerase III subunit delta [Buchnera aphidicola]|uniref:DNA polymerase III subunit delta n=1 Tax=Buchnera aphidicola str. USDA (Myzus persicae) TaxID=1009856 RepID=W0P3K9_BUCMP|nr:DNA polymerase III subunit delta [Buchnera aphidicola]AHG59950.1 Hola [Buchnera aphidicola str. USDA (Myzus persicae)]AHG60530.1 Hola [Buchnera aphidicola str. W106 (Myzus persicae)]AHG61103.1 Hola [Buchnera aphidicola str. G002 (Myzus persicae)]AHG61675.1 Hola [Buchnera aphidicola str. F009 (Myzus persicae)]WAI03367.1 MAG: DNA polymerase III subunit delta [Buchnera aphidicola (Myzus persicae)]
MNIIHLEKLKKHLIKELDFCYIFLGEDDFLINRNQNAILYYAHRRGFIKTSTINIEKNNDWEKVIRFYKTRNLFFKKTTVIINVLIKTLNTIFIENINKISVLLNIEILTILKFNHLSRVIQIKKILSIFKNNTKIVSCFTPYNLQFVNWIKYEIKEKNLNIEKKAFFLLCKYYEGNTSFIYKILEVLFKKCQKSSIKIEEIKKNIIDFFNFSVLHWINAILQGQIKKAMYILNLLEDKKHSPLILIRTLQKDLLILMHMKREKDININTFLKKYNIDYSRHNFFIKAYKKIHDQSYFKAINILVKIEIHIKQKYDNSIWIQLQKLTLILSSSTI